MFHGMVHDLVQAMCDQQRACPASGNEDGGASSCSVERFDAIDAAVFHLCHPAVTDCANHVSAWVTQSLDARECVCSNLAHQNLLSSAVLTAACTGTVYTGMPHAAATVHATAPTYHRQAQYGMTGAWYMFLLVMAVALVLGLAILVATISLKKRESVESAGASKIVEKYTAP